MQTQSMDSIGKGAAGQQGDVEASGKAKISSSQQKSTLVLAIIYGEQYARQLH